MVNALELWGKIAARSDSVKAVQFYNEYNGRAWDVLCRGKANFDEPVTNNAAEDRQYRIAYYASKSGSMETHIKRNLAVFGEYLQDIRKDVKSVLFVDYGCGPMTSGIALADVLSCSCKMADYKKRVRYHGIDASEQAVEFTDRINQECGVFAPNCFSVVQAEEFCPSNIRPPPASAQIAILCLSFVLAPGTFRRVKQDAKQLAGKWNGFVQDLPGCEETRIIYMNPRTGPRGPSKGWNPHENWDIFRATLGELSNREEGMEYPSGDVKPCEWEEGKICHMAMIKGTRQ